MVNVSMEREDNNGGARFYFDMKGHARSEDKGDPTVCAACSAIAYALLGWAINKQSPDYSIADGEMHIMVNGGGFQSETAAVWEMAEIGLRQIAQQFPEYVAVENK